MSGPHPGAAVGALAPGRLALEVAPTSTMADTSIGAVTGTVAYMAPEQARGIAVDHRADLYAVGLIAYDLLLGRRRTQGPLNPLEELTQRLDHPPPSPRSVDASIPEPIDPIVMRCLEPDPGARYQSAALLLADLEKLDAKGHRLPVIRRLTAPHGRRRGGGDVVPDGVDVLGDTAGAADEDARCDVYSDRRFRGTPETTRCSKARSKTFSATSMEEAAFIRVVRPPGGAADRATDSSRPGAGRRSRTPGRRARRHQGGAGGHDRVERAGVPCHDQGAGSGNGEAAGDGHGNRAIETGVIGAITSAAVTLRGQLGDTTPASVRRAAMETVTAGSLEALDAYERGQDLARSNKLPEALKAYRRAIALDPDFGRAYAGMAVVYNDLKDDPREKRGV